jgi:hypothetical protein
LPAGPSVLLAMIVILLSDAAPHSAAGEFTVLRNSNQRRAF